MADISLVGQPLSNFEDLKAKAEEKKAAEEKKIAENNKLGSLFGVDGNNTGAKYCTDLLFSPLTATNNFLGATLLGGEVTLTNSTDNEESGWLTGLGNSFCTLIGGIGNVFKCLGGAIGGAIQPQGPAPQGGQAPSGTSSPSSSGTANKTGDTKTEDKKEESKTSTSTTTPKTSSSSSSKNTSFGSFSYKYTTDADGNLTTGVFDKAGNAVSIDTKGYEKVSSEVRTSVEEYNEAAKDYADAEKELNGLDEKIADAEKEVTEPNQKAYAEAKGNYDAAVKQVEYLQGKQDSIAADLSAMKSQLANCSEDQKSQIEASIEALEAQREEIKTQLAEAITKRDECYEKMSEAESKLSDKKADSKTNKLAALYAKRDAAKAKMKSAKTLREKAQTTLRDAVDRADQKYSAGEFQGEDGELAKAEQMKKDEAATSAITKALDKKEGDITSQMHKRSGEISKIDILKIEAKNLGLEVKDGATLDEIQKAITDKKTTDAKAEAKKLGLEVKDGATLDEIQKAITDKKTTDAKEEAKKLGLEVKDGATLDEIQKQIAEKVKAASVQTPDNGAGTDVKPLNEKETARYLELAEKRNNGVALTPDEVKELDGLSQRASSTIWGGNSQSGVDPLIVPDTGVKPLSADQQAKFDELTIKAQQGSLTTEEQAEPVNLQFQHEAYMVSLPIGAPEQGSAPNAHPVNTGERSRANEALKDTKAKVKELDAQIAALARDNVGGKNQAKIDELVAEMKKISASSQEPVAEMKPAQQPAGTPGLPPELSAKLANLPAADRKAMFDYMEASGISGKTMDDKDPEFKKLSPDAQALIKAFAKTMPSVPQS